MKIAILGAGAFGTALGQVLLENGYEVQYYDPILKGTSLDKALSGADMVLVAVPSFALPAILPALPSSLPLIIATKGILNQHILDGFEDVMVISGPGFADDLKAHKTTLLTATDQRVVDLFTTDYLTFDMTDDVRGVLLSGALKNVYALLAGLLDLRPGTTEHEEFLYNVAEEMRDILEANGGRRETIDLACGKGDLRLTCGMPSRNYEFGQLKRLNSEYLPEKTVEGLSILRKIREGEIKVPESANYLKNFLERSAKWG